jgi:hypothetical protein
VKVAKASAATATPARITATHPKAARRLLEGGGSTSGGLVVSRPAVSLGIVRVSVSAVMVLLPVGCRVDDAPVRYRRIEPTRIDPVWMPLAAGD